MPLADVTLQQKDMLLALDLGRRLGSPVPLAAAANEMMNACRGLGIDHRDFVTAHEVYRRLEDNHDIEGRNVRRRAWEGRQEDRRENE